MPVNMSLWNDDSDPVETALVKKAIDQMYPEEKTLPEQSVKDLAGYLSAMKTMNSVADIKKHGFNGEGVDTGPLAGRIPSTLSQWFAHNIEGIPEGINPMTGYDPSASRAALVQGTTQLRQPVRHRVTGAAAGMPEIESEIKAQLPNPTDNDANFEQNLYGTAKDQQNSLNALLDDLKASGYNAPMGDVKKFQDQMNLLKSTLFNK